MRISRTARAPAQRRCATQAARARPTVPRLSVNRSLQAHLRPGDRRRAAGARCARSTTTAKALAAELAGKTKTERAAVIGARDRPQGARKPGVEMVVFDRGPSQVPRSRQGPGRRRARGRPEVLAEHLRALQKRPSMSQTRYLDAAEVEQISDSSARSLVRINRSAAVVKGGRRFSFSALSVCGNRDGVVGYGFGKAPSGAQRHREGGARTRAST